MLPKYFLWFAQTPEWEKQVNQLTKGTAQPVFSANSLKEIQIPIPSLEEQKEIIKELEREQKIINWQKQSIELLEEKERKFLSISWKN